MLRSLSQRLLTLFQLTRMALVFTAIADGLCTVLLVARARAGPTGSLWAHLDAGQVLAAATVSVGLYGFGMSLNDIIDRRRDSQIAAHRPLPSGRVGLFTAHVVCVLLILTALGAAAFYSVSTGQWMSLVLAGWTAMLITFYDLAGKYLVWPGLVTLGLIRFFHALIPGPQVPELWHPLLLLNHVTLLSAVAYRWEEKRPPLTRRHWWAVLGALALLDVLAVAMVGWWQPHEAPGGIARRLDIRPALAVPLAAAAVFVVVGWWVRRANAPTGRAGSTGEAGQ